MKGVQFIDMTGYETFPSIAFGSGAIQKEDTYKYAKRTSTGKMRRIGWVGYTVKIDCQWAMLTAAQFSTLMAYITQEKFRVTYRLGSEVVTDYFYAGNVSSTPYKLSSAGDFLYYLNVKFSIISVNMRLN